MPGTPFRLSGWSHSRREFLKHSAALAGVLFPFAASRSAETPSRSPNERFRIGAIGMRYQGSVIAEKALPHGDIVAICDVDRHVAEKARDQFGGQAHLYEDYRDLLARDDIDVVTIGTPDHWHAAMLIDACRAGKDVYCEKPLTLTVREGQLIAQVVRETERVVQVGSWQRSDFNFRLACELVHSGRLGKLNKVTVVLGKNKTGGPFQSSPPPPHFNWDRWQGQTPDVPYMAERTHYTFRWWYEYSGGQMTDWGAHHVDIAQWGVVLPGPVEIDGRCSLPNIPDGYNVAVDFEARLTYANGVVVDIFDSPRGAYDKNGVMFEGEVGRIYVNRGGIFGKPVEDLAARPLPPEDFQLYAHDNLELPKRTGKLDSIINHMANFFECVRTRNTPISDVVSQHQSITACHLANISMRLGRKLKWDPDAEQIIDDPEASTWLAREQRKGYEIKA